MRFLHTMFRVGDLDRSIAFYTEVLGMKLLRRNDYPDGRFTLAFVGYGEESETAVLELTHNWDTSAYELGNGFGHVALAVPDAELPAALSKLQRGLPDLLLKMNADPATAKAMEEALSAALFNGVSSAVQTGQKSEVRSQKRDPTSDLRSLTSSTGVTP